MTKQQLINRIEDCDYWLTYNPNHEDRDKIHTQKRDFERRLAELEKDEPKKNNERDRKRT